MDLELKGKIVFITGGSRGIGKGIARTMAREGCNIAITATRADLDATYSGTDCDDVSGSPTPTDHLVM